MTQGHPDPDDLADLAAEVLDDETSAVLRDHVGACDECAGLLDEAARMRSLLLADDPGPMPDEVWTRIEVALAAEAAQLTTVTLTAEGSVDTKPVTKLRRPIRRVHPSRRQQRQDHTGWWGGLSSSIGWGGLVAVAAGVLVVAGLGAILLQELFPKDSDVAASMIAQDGGGDSASSPLRQRAPSIMVSTGTNYRPDKLTAQVRALVARVHGDEGAESPSKAFSGKVERGAAESQVKPLGGAADRPAGAWSTSELEGCLKALKAEELSPIAVDFATFDGREVALVVLPSPAQEYEVWAVSRSCSPGADGTQFFQIVKP